MRMNPSFHEIHLLSGLLSLSSTGRASADPPIPIRKYPDARAEADAPAVVRFRGSLPAMEELLLAWYAENRRDLPWRHTHDPYAILVSEVMLQQTQVARVVPRYLAWLERWPTVEELAAATPADVITAWSGLGYNRRAVQPAPLRGRGRRAGRVPARARASCERLPGIGPYTAAAIACFAFGAQIAAPDTNARRVLGRAFGDAGVAPPPGTRVRVEPGPVRPRPRGVHRPHAALRASARSRPAARRGG